MDVHVAEDMQPLTAVEARHIKHTLRAHGGESEPVSLILGLPIALLNAVWDNMKYVSKAGVTIFSPEVLHG